MGEMLGGEPRFWGFGGLKPLLMVPGRQSECGGSSDSPRARLLSAPPSHGILGAHLGSTEFTPKCGEANAGPDSGLPLSSPRRLPGGPGAAPDGGSDLIMPRLPVSTRSTGQGICLERSSRVARRTSLRTAQALTIPTRRPPDTHLSFAAGLIEVRGGGHSTGSCSFAWQSSPIVILRVIQGARAFDRILDLGDFERCPRGDSALVGIRDDVPAVRDRPSGFGRAVHVAPRRPRGRWASRRRRPRPRQAGRARRRATVAGRCRGWSGSAS